MNSDIRNECSHSLGFPIRKSPDHSLVAASRGLSQLLASFVAFLRQGIHTHALSSLTIKSTSHTTERYFLVALTYLCLFVCPSKYSVVKDRFVPEEFRRQQILTYPLTYELLKMVGLGGLEPPTSSLSGMRSSQLSYRPSKLPRTVEAIPEAATGGAGRDRTGDLLNANQALSQLSYSP